MNSKAPVRNWRRARQSPLELLDAADLRVDTISFRVVTDREHYDPVVTTLPRSAPPIEDRLRMARRYERAAPRCGQTGMSTLDVDSDPDRAISPPADRALAASLDPSRSAAGCSTPTGSVVEVT